MRIRPTARVVLLDRLGRVFLFKYEDHSLPEPMFWATPGGAVEPGETFEQATLRGQRRTPVDAEQHYKLWQADTEAATLAPLRRQLQHLDADHFRRLSAFLGDPTWEPTNNAAERGGRAFRHGQHPHFRLRSATTIDADLKVRAHLQGQRFCSPPPTRLHHCQRGRHLHRSRLRSQSA